MQTALPVAILYLPATQAVHVPPFGPVKPRLQIQAVSDMLVPGELEPAGHAVHVALPVVSLYVPATHAVHVPPLVPVKPKLHEQLVTRGHKGHVEPEFAGHARHVATVVAATVVEYVPAGQSVHTALPVAILYLPATQAVHTPPSGPVNPTLHVQAARAELEIGEMELVGHAWHRLAPSTILYFPAAQAVHVPPLGPS